MIDILARCSAVVKSLDKALQRVYNAYKRLQRIRSMCIKTGHSKYCFYCGNEFGEMQYNRKKDYYFYSRKERDHFEPRSYTGEKGFRKKENIVLACKVCNGIKHNKIFETREEAREYVRKRREKKGYINMPILQEHIQTEKIEPEILQTKMQVQSMGSEEPSNTQAINILIHLVRNKR